MRRNLRRLAAALGLACGIATAAPDSRDAGNADQAVGMIVVNCEIMWRVSSTCIRHLPAHKRQVEYASLNWMEAHKSELDGAESKAGEAALSKLAREAAPMIDATMREFERIAKVNGYDSTCANALNGWITGETVLAKESPRASKFLQDYLLEHPLSNDRRQYKADEAGCTKQGWNSGRALDEATAFCACVTRTMHSRLSSEERAEFIERTKTKQSLTDWPPMQRITSDLVKCNSQAPSEVSR